MVYLITLHRVQVIGCWRFMRFYQCYESGRPIYLATTRDNPSLGDCIPGEQIERFLPVEICNKLMRYHQYFESGRPISSIIMCYNPLTSNWKAYRPLHFFYRDTIICGTFHDWLMWWLQAEHQVWKGKNLRAIST